MIELLSSEWLYDWARGPLLWLACIIFFAGFIFQFLKFWFKTRKILPYPYKELNVSAEPKTESEPSGFGDRLKLLSQTVLGISPVMIIITTIFHILLFLTPVFLLAHAILFEESWGFSIFVFNEKTTDILTIVILACLGFFLGRRLFYRRVRSISSFYDYIILAITALPFITGFLAYHQIFNYKIMLILHLLTGEIMLIVIPFTKLVHMLFFFLNRFLLTSEYTIGKGRRTW
jgi:nitrate reductase gamma subunit